MKRRTLITLTLCLAVIALVVVAAPHADAQQKNLIVPIPGNPDTTVEQSPGAYIANLYKWGIGLGALLALLMIVIGGAEYTLSAGGVSSQEHAKSRIQSAIFGLILLLGAVVLLTTINKGFGDVTLNKASVSYQQATQNRVNSLKARYTDPGFVYTRALADDVAAELRELERGVGTNITAAEFDAALNNTLDKLTDYYDDPDTLQRVKQEFEADRAANGQPAPGEREVKIELETRRINGLNKATKNLRGTHATIAQRRAVFEQTRDDLINSSGY